MLKLQEEEDVVQLFLQQGGVRPKWIGSKRAKTLSRQSRKYEYSPAITRRLVEISGHDPVTHYMIGAEHLIPEPTPEARRRCIDDLLQVGFSLEDVEAALATLGIPPGGRHPPKRRR